MGDTLPKANAMFYGKNSGHEFYQSEDTRRLILRVHGERSWTAHLDFGFVGGSSDPESAAKQVGGEIDNTSRWEETKPGTFKIVPNSKTAA
jgi:hypothetical protein